MMKDEGWWFQAVEGFCRQMDRQTEICDCWVTFATEKDCQGHYPGYQNCQEHCPGLTNCQEHCSGHTLPMNKWSIQKQNPSL